MVAFLVPLGIGILAGLGVGSGGLFILFLTEWAGLSQHVAQGTNLAVFVCALGGALLVHLRRRAPAHALAFTVLLFGTIGALLGGALATATDPASLRFFLGLFLSLSGAFVLLRK